MSGRGEPSARPGAARVAATVLLALAGAGGLLWATDGGTAYTSEAARRLAIVRAPRAIPAATLEDSRGAELSRALHGRGPWVVGFVYTQCATVCPDLSADFRALQDALEGRVEAADVRLLSVSFDPERDTPVRLAEYGQHFGADPGRWHLARIRDPEELERWLDTFGIVVIPDGLGGFEHNAALHWVEGGRLAAVLDPGDVDGVLTRALARRGARPGPAS